MSTAATGEQVQQRTGLLHGWLTRFRARRVQQTVLDIYPPRYGEEWGETLNTGAWYARINPRRLFTFTMPDLGS